MTTATVLHVLSPGGRGCVRRARVATLAAGCLLAAATMSPVRAETGPDVQVRQHDGVFTVSAHFDVPQAPAAVLAVLTDYEAIPRIAPEVTRSIVLARRDGRTLVEQEAVSRVLFFSKTVHLVLDVRESTSDLTFRDTCGRSFSTYEGSWRVVATPEGARVTYELRARPAFEVPDFLVRRLFKRDAGLLITRLRQAISS